MSQGSTNRTLGLGVFGGTLLCLALSIPLTPLLPDVLPSTKLGYSVFSGVVIWRLGEMADPDSCVSEVSEIEACASRASRVIARTAAALFPDLGGVSRVGARVRRDGGVRCMYLMDDEAGENEMKDGPVS